MKSFTLGIVPGRKGSYTVRLPLELVAEVRRDRSASELGLLLGGGAEGLALVLASYDLPQLHAHVRGYRESHDEGYIWSEPILISSAGMLYQKGFFPTGWFHTSKLMISYIPGIIGDQLFQRVRKVNANIPVCVDMLRQATMTTTWYSA